MFEYLIIDRTYAVTLVVLSEVEVLSRVIARQILD